MIRLEDLYTFIETSFDFLLVVDADERIRHASPLLARPRGQTAGLENLPLADHLHRDSLDSFRAGMLQARAGSGGIVVYSPRDERFGRVPLKIGCLESGGQAIYLFFGSQIDGLGEVRESDKDERIKELFCLYSVAEWIEVSSSIHEFFTRLPDYLRRGMRYPEAAVVYAVYQGRRYGSPPVAEQVLRAQLTVNRRVAGEIQVSYVDAGLAMMPEEQRMLTEIGRMLSLALERKQLRESMMLKKSEEEEHRRRLRDLEEQIQARTHEIEDQRQNLERLNSYTERVNRDWEESKTYLNTILAGIPYPVALIDRNRTLVMTNQEGVEPGDKCHKKLFHNDTPCRDCRLARIIREKAPITLTILHEGKHLEVHALPIFDQEHEVDGIMEFYRDVTLEKTYEQQLRQADRLASLGQLVSGIGHEINNPNQFIRGNIKIIKQALDDILPMVDARYEQQPDLKIARLPYPFFREHIMTLVDDMAHGSERIKSIVEGLRRFARRDEGQLIDNVDVNTLIEAAVRLVHNEVHKRAEIELDLAPDLPTLTGNSQKIEQVLINLIVNAGQAMRDEEKGHIVVRTRHADAQVVIEILDDGVGMNEKTRKQIFDPFFTTKRARGGTGLGLAIAYRIIEEHGGRIGVRSKVGKGTTFTITLPVHGASAPPPPEADGGAAQA